MSIFDIPEEDEYNNEISEQIQVLQGHIVALEVLIEMIWTDRLTGPEVANQKQAALEFKENLLSLVLPHTSSENVAASTARIALQQRLDAIIERVSSV